MQLDFDANNAININKVAHITRMFTTLRVDLIFKLGSDCVATSGLSKFFSVESKKGEVGDILWAMMDPAVGV